MASKLVDKLGLAQSLVDPCAFCRSSATSIACADGGITLDATGKNLGDFVQELHSTGLKVGEVGHPTCCAGARLTCHMAIGHALCMADCLDNHVATSLPSTWPQVFLAE